MKESKPTPAPLTPSAPIPFPGIARQNVFAWAPSILLMGPEGSGKTDALRTLVEAGLKVFIIFCEPGMEVLQDRRRGRPVYSCEEGLHWHYIPIGTPSWSDLAQAARDLNTLSFEACSQMAPKKREHFKGFIDLILTMGDLKCDRCGGQFGPADQLPYDEWAIVNDSLTGISKASLYGHIGVKAAVHKGEYGNCMFNIERYIDKFVTDIPCFRVMTAHVDREPNETTGGFENMVATLGQKLAPKIPRPFSDVILTKREGSKFSWSTTEGNHRLKTRNLDFSREIQPTFVPIVQEWKRRIQTEKDAAGANSQLQGVAKVPAIPADSSKPQ